VRNYTKKPDLEKELIQYDYSLRKENLVELKSEAELAKVPPEVLTKLIPKPIETRNRVLIVGSGTL